MSVRSGMHLLLREEAFILESLWLSYCRAKWPICLGLSNYQAKVKMWNGLKHRNEAYLGLELDGVPVPWMKCRCYPHSSLSIPPQRLHLHEKNQFKLKNNLHGQSREWKTRLTGKLEISDPKKNAIPLVAEKSHFTRIISIITSTHHFPSPVWT